VIDVACIPVASGEPLGKYVVAQDLFDCGYLLGCEVGGKQIILGLVEIYIDTHCLLLIVTDKGYTSSELLKIRTRYLNCRAIGFTDERVEQRRIVFGLPGIAPGDAVHPACKRPGQSLYVLYDQLTIDTF